MSAAPSFVIPPDAVRVWRGFRASSIKLVDFFNRLNTVLVPATVEMQVNAGLDGYISAVPAGLAGKPEGVPDETALMFWDSQQTYHDGFNTLAVRTYTLAYGAVYMPSISRADFPLFFAGTLTVDQPYYLVPRSADWMKGTVRHLIAGRPEDVTPEQFRAQLSAVLTTIQSRAELAGAIVCASDDYLVYWELPSALFDSGAGAIDALANLTAWNYAVTALPSGIDEGLWDAWPGMQIVSGDSLNMQFRRRWER